MIDLVHRYLNIDKKTLEQYYEHFESVFDTDRDATPYPSPVSKDCLPFDNSSCYYLTGVDLPCFVSGNERSRTFMIVGSEPKRNEKSFEYLSKEFEIELDPRRHIQFNTPYTFQDSSSREKGSTNVYADIIEHLASIGTVYLTDLRKVWFAGWEDHSDFLESKMHLEFLKKEIEITNPKMIFTFGKPAYNTLCESNEIAEIWNGKIKYLLHPSPTNNGRRSKFFEKIIDRKFRTTKQQECNYRDWTVKLYTKYIDSLLREEGVYKKN